MVLPFILCLGRELIEIALHFQYARVGMYSFEVRFWIERQALDIDLVHVYAIVLHYFLQVLNRLVGEWVNQLNALSAETKQLEENYRKKMESLEELKKSILQKAFSGELTRQTTEIEMEQLDLVAEEQAKYQT